MQHKKSIPKSPDQNRIHEDIPTSNLPQNLWVNDPEFGRGTKS